MSADFGNKEFDYGVGYPTPSSIPDDTSCWTIPVPNDAAWQAVLFGLLQTLTEEKSWQQYEGALSQEDAAARWAEMVTEFLFNSLVGCGATPPPGIRYFSDDDTVQIQEPDGDWVANPAADPRHSPSNEFPPIGGDSPQCDSAANMVAWIKKFIDTLVTVKDETGLITAFFLDVLELLWGAGIFLAIITLFIETLLFLGLDTVLDAFDSTVYDTLLCIFFCHIEGDGTVTADDLGRINTAIDDQIGGTVATVLHAMFFIMGEVGLSNAGSQGTETGDCSSCTDCGWCYRWDFPIADWTFDFGPNGSGSSFCHIAFSSTQVSTIEFGYHTDGVGDGGTSAVGIWDVSPYAHNLILESPLATADNPLVISVGANMTWIGLGGNADGGSGGHVTIDYIIVRGAGTNPFGTSNCTP